MIGGVLLVVILRGEGGGVVVAIEAEMKGGREKEKRIAREGIVREGIDLLPAVLKGMEIMIVIEIQGEEIEMVSYRVSHHRRKHRTPPPDIIQNEGGGKMLHMLIHP